LLRPNRAAPLFYCLPSVVCLCSGVSCAGVLVQNMSDVQLRVWQRNRGFVWLEFKQVQQVCVDSFRLRVACLCILGGRWSGGKPDCRPRFQPARISHLSNTAAQQ
jgi:hypothetical protein